MRDSNNSNKHIKQRDKEKKLKGKRKKLTEKQLEYWARLVTSKEAYKKEEEILSFFPISTAATKGDREKNNKAV